MGLDLYLEKRKQLEAEQKWGKEEEARREKENDTMYHSYPGEVEELAYGRKTWSLYYFFANRDDSEKLDDEGVYIKISKRAYDELCMKALPYEYYLKLLYDIPEENETELDDQTAEYIYNMVFAEDSGPTLGYIWDCNALYRWAFLQRDVISKAFEEDDVVMVASY